LRCRLTASKWMALPPRYARSVVGFTGIASWDWACQGFCHGATPFSNSATMLSVTSCRKSRGLGVGCSIDSGTRVSSPCPRQHRRNQSRFPLFRSRNRPGAQNRFPPVRTRRVLPVCLGFALFTLLRRARVLRSHSPRAWQWTIRSIRLETEQCKRRWQGSRYWLIGPLIWLVALWIDFAHH